MSVFDKKITVFISSICGEEPEKYKYNLVREGLKSLIESLGFAEVYVFESEGGSTISAGNHYTYSLEDSDVCIFLIDNKDGVSAGVQKEIDTAQKFQIKSLFYFCDQFSREETPLQKSLKGAIYAKSETIHDFKDIIKKGATDLVNDLISVYKHYCKGRLTWPEEGSVNRVEEYLNMAIPTNFDKILNEEIISNKNLCVNYFRKLILELSDNNEVATEEFDRCCANFLPILFEGESFQEEKMGQLLSEIQRMQSVEHFEVTQKRYEAIREYYLGNLMNSIGKLEESLQIAKTNNMPKWLIQDILIDLRNQSLLLEESKNEWTVDSKYSDELSSIKSFLYYPMLDRLDSDYYKKILNHSFKEKIKNPNVVIFGDALAEHISLLTSVFLVAMYNASITHLEIIYSRVQTFSFYCATKYSNWSIKKILIKTTIILGKTEELDGIVRSFGDVLSKLDEKDALEIYNFANSEPVSHRRLICKLRAFKLVSYYLDDENFKVIWKELKNLIMEWIYDKESVTIVGYEIFKTLKESYIRISSNDLIEIVCACLDNKAYFSSETFNFIKEIANYKKISNENAIVLIKQTENAIKNLNKGKSIYGLAEVICALRKKYRTMTNTLDKIVAVEMPNFYKGNYRLETTNEKDNDMPFFLREYIEHVREANQEQGKDGVFSGQWYGLFGTMKNIIQYSDVNFSEDLVDDVFKITCETLLCENQMIHVKIEAIELLVNLLESRAGVHERMQTEIETILNNKTDILKAKAVLTNLSGMNIQFSALFLYASLGESISMDLLNALVEIRDDVLSNRKASASVLNFLEEKKEPVNDAQLEHILLQQAVEWCAEEDVNIRWNAVQIMFSLLKNADNRNVVCNQFVKLMDRDNVYIKNTILRNIYRIKDIDIKTYNYIIQKADVDTNYVVRKVAEEIKHESNAIKLEK